MALTYTREITDEEMQALEHYTADVKQWIDEAIAGKITHCKKRLFREQIDLAIENNLPLPTTQQEALEKVFSAPDYKNRKELDILEDSTVIEALPATPEPKEETPVDGESIKTSI